MDCRIFSEKITDKNIGISEKPIQYKYYGRKPVYFRNVFISEQVLVNRVMEM